MVYVRDSKYACGKIGADKKIWEDYWMRGRIWAEFALKDSNYGEKPQLFFNSIRGIYSG